MEKTIPASAGKLEIRVSKVSDGNMSFRYGNKAEVVRNRRLWLDEIGCQECYPVELLAGTTARVLADSDIRAGERKITADGMVTQKLHTPLLLLTADCLPVVLIGKEIVGLVHAGWQNLHRGIIPTAWNMAGASQIEKVWIGPGIRKDSYRVSHPIQLDSAAWKEHLVKKEPGVFQVDLPGYVTSQVRQLCPTTLVLDSKVDTFLDKRYFSHRRSRESHEPEGRFLTAIWMASGAYKSAEERT